MAYGADLDAPLDEAEKPKAEVTASEAPVWPVGPEGAEAQGVASGDMSSIAEVPADQPSQDLPVAFLSAAE